MAKFILSAFADEAADGLDEQISALLANKIYCIEPRSIGGKPILKLTDGELYRSKASLDKAGIKVGSLGSPIGKYPIEMPFDEHLNDFKRALRVCSILGAQNMRIFSFYTPKDRLPEYRGEVISRLKTFCEIADKEGIRLCHENESGIYGQCPDEVRDLLISVPPLYSIIDPANYRMNGSSIKDGINATLLRPAYVHVKDAIYNTQQIVPAGEGEGCIAEIINILDENIDGEIMLTLEPHLHIFSAYSDIDRHELRGKYSFSCKREAFDFAAESLTSLLNKNGYRRDGNGAWTR